MQQVAVLGVGMHPWGRFPGKSYTEMGYEAVGKALADAGINWSDVQAMAASALIWSGLPGMLAGHGLASAFGDTGIPIVNISNACATAGSAFRSAYQMVALGEVDVALAVGLDQSPAGFLPSAGGAEDATDVDFLRWRMVGAPNPAYWALECQRRMQEYGTTDRHLALAKVKNSKHGALNPNARYRRVFTEEEVLASPMVSSPLRLFEICATSDGAAASVLCSADYARRHTNDPILVAAASLASTRFGDPTIRIPLLSAAAEPLAPILSESAMAVKMAYEQAGLGPEDLDVVELPDNSSWHELVYSECIGLCKPGEAERLIEEGRTALGGKGRTVVCPSGGASSLGEAVGAQGMAQVCELVWQLRGQAGARQVEGAKVGFSQVYGAQGNNAAIILKT